MPKNLNRDLVFARAYYFSFMGGWGFILPFINLFYIGLGLSGTQIGTITSTSSVAGLVFAPIIVSEIKKRPQARSILQVLIFLGALGYFLLGQQTGYFPILVIVFFQALVGSSVMPVSDSMALSVSKESGSGYGGIRVFASIGWIISVLASGWLIERFDFGAGFIGVSLMWMAGAGFVFFIQPGYFVARPNAQSPKSNVWTTIQRVTRDRTLLGFAVALIFIGFMNSGVLQFENVFLAELGASTKLISIAGILSAVVELPFMIYADRYVRKYGSSRILLIALLMIMLQRASRTDDPFHCHNHDRAFYWWHSIQLIHCFLYRVDQQPHRPKRNRDRACVVYGYTGKPRKHSRRAHFRNNIRCGRRKVAVCAVGSWVRDRRVLCMVNKTAEK